MILWAGRRTSATRARTVASSRGNDSAITGAVTVTAVCRSGAVSLARRAPAPEVEAYLVSVTSVAVAGGTFSTVMEPIRRGDAQVMSKP